ncbi:MAG TPA: hypothetical protein ENK02_07140 [Planctomycetes bacterium]|nr:hypothetical protein [Planctomycetota bacterium]
MRPTFERPLPSEGEFFFQLLREALERGECPCRGKVFKDHAILEIREEDQHFWSPHLGLKVLPAPAENEANILHGRFSPNPGVWTLFLAIYGVLGIAALGGLVYGLAQWSTNESPWALLVTPAAIALMGFTYGAAFIGQGLGSEQMFFLRSFTERVLERARERKGQSTQERSA